MSSEHSSWRVALACSVVVAVFTVTARVCAEPPPADSEYGALIRRGVEAYEAHDLAGALRLFEQAHAVEPSARTERAVGIAKFELGEYEPAVEWLKRALADPRHSLTEAQRHEAEQLIAAASRPAPAVVGVAQPILRAERRSSGTRRTVAWITGVAGVLAVAAGAAAGVISIASRAESDRNCPDVCNRQGVEAMDRSIITGNISTISLIVGAAAVTTTLVLWSTEDTPSEARASSAVLGIGLTSIQLKGTF